MGPRWNTALPTLPDGIEQGRGGTQPYQAFEGRISVNLPPSCSSAGGFVTLAAMRRWVCLVTSVLGLGLSLLSGWAKPPTVSITNVVRADPGVIIQWEASSAELQFTVERRDALTSGGWEPLPNVPWPIRTNGVQAATSDPSVQFFRVSFEPVAGRRGRLISATRVSTLNQALINFVFTNGGYPITADRAVEFYKLVYETVDAQGLPTIASGALALPVGVSIPLPLVTYQHGTIVRREDVPSRLNLEGLIGVAFATAGYAAVLPDYLGLGDSPGVQPYHHARSEATCVIDLLRAARTYAASNDVALSDRLFLAGYSHGGHATLAALREIEANHADQLVVTACVAGAGAYDLSGTTLNRVSGGAAVP